eukprot:gene8702-10222_t
MIPTDLSFWKGAGLPDKSRVLEGRYARLERVNVEKHREDLWTALSDASDPALWNYLPYGPFNRVEEFDQWLESKTHINDPFVYTIISKDTGKALGLAALMAIVPDQGSIEIGHVLFGPLLQRTPVATEAIFLLAKEAFRLGNRRLEWKCDNRNERSKRAAQRYGFTFEGIFRQHRVVKGANRDSAYYSIIDSEWPRLEQKTHLRGELANGTTTKDTTSTTKDTTSTTKDTTSTTKDTTSTTKDTTSTTKDTTSTTKDTTTSITSKDSTSGTSGQTTRDSGSSTKGSSGDVTSRDSTGNTTSVTTKDSSTSGQTTRDSSSSTKGSSGDVTSRDSTGDTTSVTSKDSSTSGQTTRDSGSSTKGSSGDVTSRDSTTSVTTKDSSTSGQTTRDSSSSTKGSSGDVTSRDSTGNTTTSVTTKDSTSGTSGVTSNSATSTSTTITTSTGVSTKDQTTASVTKVPVENSSSRLESVLFPVIGLISLLVL